MLTRATRWLICATAYLVATLSAAPAAAQTPVCAGVPATVVLTPANPTFSGTQGNDVVVGSNVDDTISGAGGDDLICPQAGNDTVDGGDGDDGMFGDGGNDSMDGAAGDDLLVGLSGSDPLTGGPGSDTAEYWDVPEAASGFTVDVDLSANTGVTPTGTDQLLGIERVAGSDYRDRLVGDANRNEFYAGMEADVIEGGDGEDRVFADGDNQDETPAEAPGVDEVHGGGGNDYINGVDGNDLIFGDAGNDLLNGEGGDDQIDGGADLDFGYYACAYTNDFCNSASAGITVDLQTGAVSGAHGSDQLSSIGGVIGTDFADTLLGSPDADDYFFPRLGDDVVNGRGGDAGDWVDYICELANGSVCGGAGVTIDLGAGTVTGAQGMDQVTNVQHAVGSTQADVIVGSAADNEFFGQQGGDTIDGGDGNDGITGEVGNDLLSGGDGLDRLNYAHVGCADGVGATVHLSGGTATGDGADTIAPTFEQLIGSSCDDVLTGSSKDEQLFGSGGKDVLNGRGGSDLLVPHLTQSGPVSDAVTNAEDALFGGAGDDTVSYAGASGPVSVDLATGGVASDGDGSSDRAFSIEAVLGSAHNDVLAGSAATNVLLGDLGDDSIAGRGANDYLDGQLGNDALDGGAGRADFVDYHDPGSGAAAVSVDLTKKSAALTTAAGVQIDGIVAIEGVAGTDAADKLFGDGASNFLLGEGGDDGTLSGKDGDDVLLGGDGSQKLRGGPGVDVCAGGKRKDCERKKPSKAVREQLAHLDALRRFRATGVGEGIQQLENALGAMRRHRRETPPSVPVTP